MTFFSSQRSLTWLVVASLTSITTMACTKETSSRQSHDPAQSQASEAQETSPRSGLALQTTPEDVDLFLRKFKVQMSVEKLEAQLRDTNVDTRNELFSYIENAGLLVETLKPGAQRSKLVETFMTAAQFGCDSKLNGCRFISLFRRHPGSVSLALAGAQENQTATERLRALSLAFAMVGQVDDSRIARAYLRSTPAIESSTDDKNLGTLKNRHREIVEHSLRVLETSVTSAKAANRPIDSDSSKLLEELSQAWDIFNFARTRAPENTSRENLLFSMVSDKLLASDELSKQVELSQQLDSSMTKKSARTAAPAKKAFGLSESIPNDFHLFIFDGLWMGRLTISEADSLWAGYLKGQTDLSRTDDVRALAQVALLNYFKTRLLTTSKDVNGIVVDFFNAKDKFITANAFQDGLKETLKGATLWADARRRFETLQEFNERNLRSTNFEAKSTKDLEQFMASLDRNIKVLSTYPSMLVMAYNLARLNFSLKVYTWTGVFEIKAGLILDWFFSGGLSPWMAYSNDRSLLSKSEISQVFYYALEMGVLTESGVNLEDLFKMLTEQMVGPLRADVQKIDDSFRAAYDEDPLAVEFRRLCELQKTTGKPADAAPTIHLKDIKYYTISGTPQLGLSSYLHPTFNSAWAFFENDQMGTRRRLDENLEIIRLEFTPKINQLRLLYRMVNDHLERHGVADRSKTSASIHQRIEALETLRKRVYSRIFRLTKNTSPCGEQAIDYELSSQAHSIEGLIAHFKLVHSEMKTLRKGNSAREKNETSTEMLNQKFGFSGRIAMAGIEAHESGLGFNGEMYRISRLQVLLRLAEILESGYVDGGKTVPPRRNKGSITIPSRVQDVEVALRKDTLRLDWSDDVDEFVTNGIQQIFLYKANFMMWTGLNSVAISLQGRIRSMTSLAKAGFVDTELGPQRIEPKEVARLTLKTAKWLEVENSVWVSVLNVTGEYTRLDLSSVLDDYAREAGNHNWIGTLDFMFKLLTKDKLGEGDEGETEDGQSARFAERMGALASYRMHSRTLRAMSQPALNVPAATMAALDELYKGSVDQQVEFVTEFLEEARRLEELRKVRPDVFPAWRIYSSRKSPDVPVLTVSAVEHFRSHMLEFGRQTGYVLPAKAEAALKVR